MKGALVDTYALPTAATGDLTQTARLRDEDELYSYLSRVFDAARITEKVVRKAAEVKTVGGDLLRKAPDPSLCARRLSTCDAFTLAIALDRALPVLSGDRDLAYVAGGLRVR